MAQARPGGHKGSVGGRAGRPDVSHGKRHPAERPTGARPALTTPPEQHPPDPPADWPASKPEFWCYDWLTRKRHMTDGVDFAYQSRFQGGRQPGGQIVDFIIYQSPPLGLFINGVNWHAGTLEKLSTSQREVQQVKNYGWNTAVLWDDDMFLHLDYVMEQALDYGRSSSERPLPF